MIPVLSLQERATIQDRVADAINGMKSQFFSTVVSFEDSGHARYAAQLWPSEYRIGDTDVRFLAKAKPKEEIPPWDTRYW